MAADRRPASDATLRVIGVAGDDPAGTLLRTYATACDLWTSGRRTLLAMTGLDGDDLAGPGPARPGVRDLLLALPLAAPAMHVRLIRAAIVPGDAVRPHLLPAGIAPPTPPDGAAIELLLEGLRQLSLDDVLVPIEVRGDPWTPHVDGVLGAWSPAVPGRQRARREAAR